MQPRAPYRIGHTLPEPKESTRTLSKRFDAITSNVSGVNVQCYVCKQRGRVNSKLWHRGQRFTCGSCSKATT